MPGIPTHGRRRLGNELRRLRLAAKLTVDAVAEENGWHRTKVIRIEAARVSIARHDLLKLSTLYEATSTEVERLERWMDDSRDFRWWLEYSNVISSTLEEYISLEAQATKISVANTGIVPGILQSRDYARAIFAASPFVPDPDEAEMLIQVRMRRQQALVSEEPAQLVAVISEGLLMVETGGREVLASQLRHLMELSELPNVALHVIPFRAVSAALSGGITVYDFADEHDVSVAYAEFHGGMVAKDSDLDVRRMRRSFEHLRSNALSPEESGKLISTRLEEL